MNTSKSSSPALRMVRQRSVGEAKPSDIIQAADSVENTATVQGPEPEMADQNRHDGSDSDRCVPRERFDPADVELFPGHQGGSCSLEIGFAVPNRDSRLDRGLDVGVSASDDSDWAVRQRQVMRFTKEPVDSFQRRTSSQEHRSLRRTRDCQTGLHERARRQRSRTVEPAEHEASAPQRAAIAG